MNPPEIFRGTDCRWFYVDDVSRAAQIEEAPKGNALRRFLDPAFPASAHRSAARGKTIRYSVR